MCGLSFVLFLYWADDSLTGTNFPFYLICMIANFCSEIFGFFRCSQPIFDFHTFYIVHSMPLYFSQPTFFSHHLFWLNDDILKILKISIINFFLTKSKNKWIVLLKFTFYFCKMKSKNFTVRSWEKLKNLIIDYVRCEFFK